MKKKVCIRKDGVVFPFTPLLEAKGFAVDTVEVGEPSKVTDPPADTGAEPSAPPVDDVDGMTKVQLVEYAARVFNVSLAPNMSKPDMLAEIASLQAEAAKAPA
jgi:hypothetical protein